MVVELIIPLNCYTFVAQFPYFFNPLCQHGRPDSLTEMIRMNRYGRQHNDPRTRLMIVAAFSRGRQREP